MEDILDFFESIADMIESAFDFLSWLIDDFVYLLDLLTTLVANFGDLFIWIPPTVYITLYAILGVIVIYKFLGR